VAIRVAERPQPDTTEDTMAQTHEPTLLKPVPPSSPAVLRLDDKAIEAARRSRDGKAITPADAAWRTGLVKLLNDALATELVCVLRYRRHHYTARGLASAKVAEEFLVHANEELAHADRLAGRICQLGGEPDFSPATLTERSHADYDDATDLLAMIRANLVAELVAIESYGQLVALVGDQDPTTRRLLEDILGDEQQHADELQGWLAE
jgi:bacterioferritin